MAKVIYDILDENFFQKTAYDYRLNLLLTDSTCTYLLHDDKQWLAYRSYALEGQNRTLFSLKDELETLMFQDKILNLSFQSVDIQLLTNAFTLVPNRIFEESKVSSYLSNITPMAETEVIKMDKNDDFTTVYVLKLDLQRFLQKTFPSFRISHSLTHLLATCEAHATNTDGKKMYLNFHQNQLQIAHFDEGKFIYANNFPFQTSNDAAYYTMLVVNQLKLNPETVQLYLSGHVDKNAELYNAIFRYVRNVNFFEMNIEHEADSPFSKFPRHTFVDVFF